MKMITNWHIGIQRAILQIPLQAFKVVLTVLNSWQLGILVVSNRRILGVPS